MSGKMSLIGTETQSALEQSFSTGGFYLRTQFAWAVSLASDVTYRVSYLCDSYLRVFVFRGVEGSHQICFALVIVTEMNDARGLFVLEGNFEILAHSFRHVQSQRRIFGQRSVE